MAGFDNETMYASNVDFSGNTTVTGQVTTDGQLLIGSTSTPNIRVGNLTATTNKMQVTNGSGSISIDVVPGNIDINGLGGTPLTTNKGGTGRTTLTNHGVLIGAGTSAITQLPAGSAGQVLRSGGASADPAYSTATYPATAGTSGTILRSDGTNFVNSTATYPNTAGVANHFLTSNGTNFVTTTPAYPNAASPGTGKFIISDGTNWVASTPTLPTAAGTAGTLLRSNGTDFINTVATYPTTIGANAILYGSSANAVGSISSANNSLLGTNGSGVPSFGTSLDNDYTFTSSTAAVDRVLTITNTDNTNVASASHLNVSVGGTSSGDPYVVYGVGSTRAYCIGVDNSDSQSLKINTAASSSINPSLGTNLFTIDSSGNRSLPLNACCTVDLNTGLTNATGDGTFVNPVIFDTESGAFFDQNGNYNTTTGIFTANATGKYLVTASVTFNSLTVLYTSGILRIDLNGGTYKIVQFNPGASLNSTNEFTADISCIIPVAATGTIAILAQVSGSTKTVGIKGNTSGSYTNFSCVLVS